MLGALPPLLFYRIRERGVWVNGRSFPPLLFRAQEKDRKVQVRGARVCVSRRADKTDDAAALNAHSLAQIFRVPVQVRIVVAINSRVIEFVNRVATGFAEEQLADRPRDRCVHRRPARRQNVDGFVTMPAASFGERVPQVRDPEATNGR